MKNNFKLGLITLVTFGSVLATIMTSLAWFVTQRNVSISVSEALVTAGDGDIHVTFRHSLNTKMTNEEVNVNEILLVGNNQVTDISGDGINLYKPIFANQSDSDHNNWVASQIKELATDGTEVADGRFIDFTINISRDLVGDGYKIFLGDETGIVPLDEDDPKDKGIVKAMRMAVINYDDGNYQTGTPMLNYLHTPEVEDSPRHLVKDASGTAYGVNGYRIENGVSVLSAPFITETNISAAEANYPPIADLMTESETDVTFRFFVEGMDIDANENNMYGSFRVVLDIYSLSI